MTMDQAKGGQAFLAHRRLAFVGVSHRAHRWCREVLGRPRAGASAAPSAFTS
jgi:hypothetical protein